ncbi:hypothetical protein MBCUT_20230 [Methanobrevibacter cuticularis]|uniref:Uncharacterized protein n=1 Tax=Methanobrevibacter cuticularis TaxID=47311 RepID=A0A166CLF8_9EURY|nr:hypothetical protein [Methanobrevibacter cuticularis]KZX14633.1 hypothetical protein MBCUT_20230 [Methanobrevibacter cuticularis]
MVKKTKQKNSGLGRGLDSLIPKYYEDEEEKNDSHSSITLEDILGNTEKDTEEKISTKKDEEEIEEEIKNNEKEQIEPKKIEEFQVEENINKSPVSTIVQKSPNENNIQNFNDDISTIPSPLPTNMSEETNEVVENIEEVPNINEENSIAIENNESSLEENDRNIVEEKVLSEYELESIEEVKEIIEKNPRITLWSIKSAAVFRYLRKTRPEFSISKEASKLVDSAVSTKYPEIWELFEDL